MIELRLDRKSVGPMKKGRSGRMFAAMVDAS